MRSAVSRQHRIRLQISFNLFALFSRFSKFRAAHLGWSLMLTSFVFAQQPVAVKPGNAADESSLNYQKCWSNSIVETTAISFVVKNEKLILPQPNGVLTALNAVDGATLWRSDLGGEITAQIVANRESVFVATIAVVNGETSSVLRAISLETGVTVWQAPFDKTSLARLTLAENSILAVLAGADTVKNQELTALNVANGERIWTKPTAAISALKSFGDKVYYAAADNRLHILAARDGGEIKQFRLPHAATELVVNNSEKLLISDQTGNLSALREADGKKLWKLRLGGAVQQILLVGDQVLISSLDDFVYLHAVKNGRRRWRKRLASRPLGAVLIENKAALIIVVGASENLFLNLETGAPIGQLIFPDQSFAAVLPIFENHRLSVNTSAGVSGWRSAAANCAAAE